jgi:hypothetical protein
VQVLLPEGQRLRAFQSLCREQVGQPRTGRRYGLTRRWLDAGDQLRIGSVLPVQRAIADPGCHRMMVSHEHDRTTEPSPPRAGAPAGQWIPRRSMKGPSLGLQAWTDYFFKIAWRLLGIAAAAAALGAGEPVLQYIHGWVH